MSSTSPLILVVDDDAPIRRVIRIAAESVGYRVEESATVADACIRAALVQPHAVILDLGLPDGDGLDVLRSIRSWSQIPVIVLTAKIDDALVVTALDAGADDHVSKPFSMPALLARIRVALRHAASTAAPSPLQQIGDITIDHAARKVHKAGSEVHLTATEYDLLATLAKHIGKILTHSTLLKLVWGSPEADPQVLRVYIRQLRQKLESDPSSPILIKTAIGVGYRLDAPEN